MHLSDCRKKNSVGSVDQDPAGSHDSAVSNIGLKESGPINELLSIAIHRGQYERRSTCPS